MSEFRNEIERTSRTLRASAIAQVTDYEQRFSSMQTLYDDLLSDLIRMNFKSHSAYETAREFFGMDTVRFAGIDGTMYSRSLFDMVIFFGGAYASTGTVTFKSDSPPTIHYDEKVMRQKVGISSIVPIYINEIVEIDQAFYSDQPSAEANPNKTQTDQSIVDNSTIANWIMTFSEYYLAFKFATGLTQRTNIILLDRSLSIERASLLYDTSKHDLWKYRSTIRGAEIDGETIDDNDLSIARQCICNPQLTLPAARGDYLTHAVTDILEKNEALSKEQISEQLEIVSPDREKRLKRTLDTLIRRNLLFKSQQDMYSLNLKYKTAKERIGKLVAEIGERFFYTKTELPMKIKKQGTEHWLTTLDISFLTLFTLHLLMEKCWKNHILLIGITKDTAARDFKRQLVPIMQAQKTPKTTITQEKLAALPNTDRMILQSTSMFNPNRITTPWSLIEYDSAFRTMIPDPENRRNHVAGAIKNRIGTERIFVKTYVQLSQARNDNMLRSNVLLMDRLVYPEYDYKPENTITLTNEFGGAFEPVEVILFRDKGQTNKIQDLTMTLLVAMAPSTIPEAFGHNKPLFIADKIAKWNYNQFKTMIDSTAGWMLNNRKMRKFIFYMSTFRERRASIEAARRENA